MKNGGELLLLYIQSGQLCSLITSYCILQNKIPVSAIEEEDMTILMALRKSAFKQFKYITLTTYQEALLIKLKS